MNDKILGSDVPKVILESSLEKDAKFSFPEDCLGKWTLLYFYPKDDTPGCTKQACAYRDNLQNFREKGVQLLGVSLDDLNSHDAFIKKFNLNFPLLADINHELSSALGSYGDQEWKGKVYKGLSRDTFLIDPNAKIKEVWRKVNPETTMDETLNAIKKYVQ